jgi:MoaA/NifB/PqqE/SkfB family radical SAM enzyme
MGKVKPTQIRLETSSFCQLRCPACPTANKQIQPVIGSGFLKLRDFQKLVDENPWVKQIELSNYGEIFLNPEILSILKYAHEHGVVVSAANGSNLNNVKAEVLEGVVKYQVRAITCSIDGASQEVYQIYRVGGNFETVIENIKKINSYKEKYQSEYPHLNWQYVVFGHNEHEIPAARQMAQDLGMRFSLKLSWDSDLAPVEDHSLVREELGALSREEYQQTHGTLYRQVCHQLWDQPQINWDGKMLGCCANFWGDFGGNAFTDGLLNSINSEKMAYAREMLVGKQVAREGIPCTTCSIYEVMKSEGLWVKRRSRNAPMRTMRSAYRFLGLHRLRQRVRDLRKR